LKILVMLLSNWDTKDRRDVARGSNTAIFEHAVRGGREARYLITDWGGSMGAWGTSIITRGRWDPAAFEAQTSGFVASADDSRVTFGYGGQRTEDVAGSLTRKDVRWILRVLGRITDDQFDTALAASGATAEERLGFGRALRARITQLREAVTAPELARSSTAGTEDQKVRS
jgi:hypothetical protein